MIKEPCNLIVNKNFFRYEACTGKQRMTLNFAFGYFQQKVMTKFFDSQKTHFWILFGPLSLILGQTRIFPENLFLSLFSVFRFLFLCRISEKKLTDFKKSWLQT